MLNGQIYLKIWFYLTILILYINAQLIINIRNGGGEVFQVAISANTSENMIEVEYQNTDGSLVTQLIDFQNHLQIFRLIILGEQERGDSQKYQRLCYVTSLKGTSFISSDDISKLRQKNPGTIREAEEKNDNEIIYMNIKLNLDQSIILSKHINRLCETSQANEYTQIYAYLNNLEQNLNTKLKLNYIFLNKSIENENLESNLKNRCFMKKFNYNSIQYNINQDNKNHYVKNNNQKLNLLPKNLNDFSNYWQAKSQSKNKNKLLKQTLDKKYLNKKFILNQDLNNNNKNNNSSCYCKIEICIPWYPCMIKFCQIKSQMKPNISQSLNDKKVRCGIKSCKKCWHFYFHAISKLNCLWDE